MYHTEAIPEEHRVALSVLIVPSFLLQSIIMVDKLINYISIFFCTKNSTKSRQQYRLLELVIQMLFKSLFKTYLITIEISYLKQLLSKIIFEQSNPDDLQEISLKSVKCHNSAPTNHTSNRLNSLYS